VGVLEGAETVVGLVVPSGQVEGEQRAEPATPPCDKSLWTWRRLLDTIARFNGMLASADYDWSRVADEIKTYFPAKLTG
jgi:hypothetical protein